MMLKSEHPSDLNSKLTQTEREKSLSTPSFEPGPLGWATNALSNSCQHLSRLVISEQNWPLKWYSLLPSYHIIFFCSECAVLICQICAKKHLVSNPIELDHYTFLN